jgi:Domain of unknown function (DUF4301)
MFSTSDEAILEKRGISKQQIDNQLQSFFNGFPYLEIKNAASIDNGILKIDSQSMEQILNVWSEYLNTNATILKFVPASGAASRMFKDLFEFIERGDNKIATNFEKKFFSDITKFAFYTDLDQTCLKNNGKSIEALIAENQYVEIVKNLLLDNGLNYGALPKGLLKFHSYPTENRTPMLEHLVEGALYASNNSNIVNIHYTVSKEHRLLFEKHFEENKTAYEKALNVSFNISFSEQKPSTDTIAADENNLPFRDKGELVFRPGGHGALIENLNDLTGDVIFIKNIDNVVPDSLKASTVTYKKLIAGLLVKLQRQSFQYLKELENNAISTTKLKEIALFSTTQLYNINPSEASLTDEELRNFLIGKLNRPIRICGMVKNEGEPGGGPFMTVNADGTVSPQILESSQINLNNPVDKETMQQSTHFNPVDLVCGIKNYRGEKFDLLKFVDKNTGFISLKSKNGKELKALELPGLWNGAMSDWNTIFVEVPVATFNPVKTVNDLLRTEHQ